MYIYWITKFLHSRNFNRSLASNTEEHVKCASLNNRPGQARPILVNICGPNKVNNLNVKVFHSII